MNAASWLEALPAQERWRALLLSEGPRIATWVLGVALVVQAAFIVTDLAGEWRASRPPVRTPAGARATRWTSPRSPRRTSSASGPGRRTQTEICSPSKVPLVLTGIIAGNDPQNGLAILGRRAQAAKVYAVGDTVARRREAALGVHRPRGHRSQRRARSPSPCRTQAAPAMRRRRPRPRCRRENPALERMRRMITEQPGLIGDVMRPQPVIDHGQHERLSRLPGARPHAPSRAWACSPVTW